MQTKANRPDLGKAEQSKRDQACPGISGRPNQDSTDTNRRTQTKTTRQTRPGPINQHRRPRPYETYTRQTKSNEADRRSANQTHHNRPNRSSHHVSTHESNHFTMRNPGIDKHMKKHDEQRTIPPPNHIQKDGSNTPISPTTSPKTKKQAL